jgi:hypothetical protein
MKTAHPNDRVIDRTAEFSARFMAHQRYNTPRQRRLRCEKAATVAQFHEAVTSVLGGLLLIAFVLVLLFI